MELTWKDIFAIGNGISFEPFFPFQVASEAKRKVQTEANEFAVLSILLSFWIGRPMLLSKNQAEFDNALELAIKDKRLYEIMSKNNQEISAEEASREIQKIASAAESAKGYYSDPMKRIREYLGISSTVKVIDSIRYLAIASAVIQESGISFPSTNTIILSSVKQPLWFLDHPLFSHNMKSSMLASVKLLALLCAFSDIILSPRYLEASRKLGIQDPPNELSFEMGEALGNACTRSTYEFLRVAASINPSAISIDLVPISERFDINAEERYLIEKRRIMEDILMNSDETSDEWMQSSEASTKRIAKKMGWLTNDAGDAILSRKI